MSDSSLRLTLAAQDRPGRFTLSSGLAHYSFEFRPETDVTLSDLVRRLHPILIGGHDPSGNLSPFTLFREIGTRLWRALLPDTAPVEMREALTRELRTGITPLLLTLPHQLATLPWELLCDPQRQGEEAFLVRRRPLVRLIPSGTGLPSLVPPLRVLLLIASPPELDERQRIDIESERAAVESAIQVFREKGLLHLLVEDIVTPRRVQQALMRFKPHLVHFVGHGSFEEGTGGALLWEDDQGHPLPLPETRLADLLRPRGLHAVLLHGCETASSDPRSDLRGVAGTLIEAGIPAVLAQQAGFSYTSSQRASEALYTALTAGFGLAKATFEVRQALTQADRPDWAVPTLQATQAGLVPLLDGAAPPGIPDPALGRSGAAADLPAPTGVFVGRQRELRALRTMLESVPGDGPVLALMTGPGGVGKSTLAAQAITRYGGRYKAALTLSCLSYQGVDLFLQRIAEFLQRQGVPGLLEEILPDPKLGTSAKIEGAIDALNTAGPFLLIVDNLESVQREDRALADADLLQLLQKLLTNLRGGRVLIAGRYAVEGLLPQGKFAANILLLDLDDLSSYEIRQLLSRHPTLARLGETTREELVRQFGGLPYFYDLLSSQAAGQNLAALIHDVQGRITRERKQRAATEWEAIRRRVVEFAALEATVACLPVQVRTLLARISVFRRPFPLQALEQGLSATRLDWQPLLDWALLRYDPTEGDYRLHSLTARYAEGLLEAADRLQTQVQVAAWYLRYADDESHNLVDYLEAHRLFQAAGKAERAGQLAMSLAEMLRRFGLYHRLSELCRETMSSTQGALAAQAQYELGNIAQAQGQYEEARRLYQQALTSFERLGDQAGQARALGQLGMIAQSQGQYEEARRLYQQALTSFERLGDQAGQARTLHGLGMIAQSQGQYEEARRLYQEALTSFERLGDQAGRAGTLHQLGMIAQDQEEARRLYQQALTSFERLGDQAGQARTLHELGNIAYLRGQYEEARRLYQQALTSFERLSDQAGRAGTLGQLGLLARQQGNTTGALRYTVQALLLFEHLRSPYYRLASRTMAQLRAEVGEEVFMTVWQEASGGRPVPENDADEPPPSLLQRLIAFIQARTWSESQQLVEADRALMSGEADALLEQLAAQQDTDVQSLIEQHRVLLARCREVGIAAAFAELIRQDEQNGDTTP
jgi:tetratricopeptide (TPR) repeat protein